jgi:hypothetical protein
MRAGTAAIFLLCMGLFSPIGVGTPAQAQSQAADIRLAQADIPPPRKPARLRVTPYANPDGVYPRYNPGPNAVRVCNATYVQEFRPSGTVIVPRVSCVWRPG